MNFEEALPLLKQGKKALRALFYEELHRIEQVPFEERDYTLASKYMQDLTKPEKVTDEQILELYNDSKDVQKVALEFSVSVSKVRKTLSKYDAYHRSKNNIKKRNQNIVKDIKIGMTEKEVAKKYGITLATVRRIRREKIGELPSNREELVKKLTDDRLAGLTEIEIAKKHGFNKQYVGRILRENKVKPPKKKRDTELEGKILARLREKDLPTYASVARELGVSKTRVSLLAREFKIGEEREAIMKQQVAVMRKEHETESLETMSKKWGMTPHRISNLLMDKRYL